MKLPIVRAALFLLLSATSSLIVPWGVADDVPPPPPEAGAPAPADAPPAAAPAPDSAAAAPAPAPPEVNAQAPAAPADPDSLSQALTARTTGRFSGKPITIQVRNVDVTDILRLISEASGFNILVGDDVRGKITLSLVDVPWDQALDVVLRTMQLGAERNNNLLRVVTLASLTSEKELELRAKKAALAASPTVTRIFPVSYADPTELSALLSKFGSSKVQGIGGVGGGEGGGGSISGPISQIQVDKRTNSIVIQDVAENVDKMEKLIHLLDTATPQVLIEAKIIEATENFSKNLGGSLGVGSAGGAANQFFGSFNSANPLDPLIGSPGVFANGANAAGAAGGGSQFGFSPSLSFIPGIGRLNAVLAMAETEDAVKVISSPKLVVLNKEKANVVESTPVGLPIQSVSNGVTTTTVQISQANISLSVTPTVTNDSGVQLELNMERGVPIVVSGGGQAVGNRNMATKVLVESGSTLVIGGVYTLSTDHASSGFPFLRNIPILGFLFGSESDSTARSELFFFITPRILNPKEAGLAG